MVEIRVRYAVTSEGRVENAEVTYVAISEDSPALNTGQLADIRSEIPQQIEESWRYEAGSFRACERSLVWRSY